jgi:hypothetical protein
MLGRRVTDGKNALNHQRIELRWRVKTGAGAATQHGIVIWGSLNTSTPFLYPTQRAAESSREITVGPGGLGAEQRSELGAICQPVGIGTH